MHVDQKPVAPVQKIFALVQDTLGRPSLQCVKTTLAPFLNHFEHFEVSDVTGTPGLKCNRDIDSKNMSDGASYLPKFLPIWFSKRVSRFIGVPGHLALQ